MMLTEYAWISACFAVSGAHQKVREFIIEMPELSDFVEPRSRE